MPLSTNRGGPKPRMLPAGQDVPFMIRDRRKVGVYERSEFVLARRVELPAWLYNGLQSGCIALTDSLRMPREEIGESRGQIYVDPPPELFDGPAVGLDMEVFDILERMPQLGVIRFYVYGNAYALVDAWQITRQRFLREAKFVETKKSFMPQMMVPVSVLSSARHLIACSSPSDSSHH